MSIIISNGDLIEVIKRGKLESIEEVPELDNVDVKDNNNIEELVIDSEADKSLVLFEKIFNKKYIQQQNIMQDLDAEDGANQDISIEIVNKVSEKIENSTG